MHRTLAVEQLDDRLVLSGMSPVAVNDVYNLEVNGSLSVDAPGILANDNDPEGDALTASVFNNTSHGTLQFTGDGSFTYTPNPGFTGFDSFSYRLFDGTSFSKFAAVTLKVTAATDPPLLDLDANDSTATGSDFAATFVEDASPLLIADTDATLTDPDSANLASLTVTITNLQDGAAEVLTANTSGTNIVASYDSGVLSLTGNDTVARYRQVLGTIAYHNSSQNPGAAPRVITLVASDGAHDSNVATATITIVATNDAPQAVGDQYFVDEDTTLVVPAAGVLGNDTDAEGNSITAVLVAAPSHGDVVLAADGSFIYNPHPNFSGSDVFTYRATDGTAAGNVAMVTITVVPVNDLPTAVADFYNTTQDGALNVVAAGVLANDSDVDGDPLSATLVSGPLHGTLTLNIDGSFSYVPNAGYAGPDSFVYQANDAVAGSSATVSINVAPVNAAPVAVNDAYEVDEDGVITVTGPGVLANDSDAEGSPLTAKLVTGPMHGTVTLNADGSFTYTPDPDFNGIDGFSYMANDGADDSDVAAVTFTVNAVNDVPIASEESYVTDEDTPLVISPSGVLGNDLDPDGDPLVAVLVAGTTNGALSLNPDGSFSYTPDANFNGVDSFTYQASDGAISSNVVTVAITVNAINDLPTAVNDSYVIDESTSLVIAAPGVLDNDIDVDGDPLSAILVTGPIHGSLTFNPDGSFTYTPDASFHGIDGFSYRINDGTVDSDVAAVTITVNPVNDLPEAANDAYTTDEDTALVIAAAGVLSNDSDADGDPLTAAVVTGPANGSLTLNPDGSFSYTPNANFHGVDSFTYHANDGTADGNIATVTITVSAVNDSPESADDAYTTDEDTALVIAAAGVLSNDSDADGDPLMAALVTGPANGSLVLNPDGSFSYTPNANFHGADSFTYHANDGTADGNIATVTITVSAVNDSPEAADDSYTTDEDTALVIAAAGVLSNDSDADGDPLTAMLVTGPANGTLTLNADGSFSYTPSANFSGTDSFTYRVNDGTADGNVATVTITVSAVNDSPEAADDSYSVNEDGSLADAAPGVLGNDGDLDGDLLTAVIVTGPSSGSLILNPDGSFNYTPTPGFVGSDSFTYVASDGASQSNTATVMITVNGVNVAPVAGSDSFHLVEDGILTVPAVGVLLNDTDANGNPLTATLVSGPSHGTLMFNDDGSFTYIPAVDFFGMDGFTYQATDGTLASNVATVMLMVAEGNDDPIAEDDALSPVSFESGPRTISAAELLANDSPGPANEVGQTISIVAVGGALHGVVTLAMGVITFTPDPGYHGPVSFTYTIEDDGTTGGVSSPRQATGVVTFLVQPPVGTGLQFDFNGSVPLTAAGYIGVGVDNQYPMGDKGYGWFLPAFTVARQGQPDFKLRDGHWGNHNSFLVDGLAPGTYLVNVTIGDVDVYADNVQLKVTGALSGTPAMYAVPGQFATACVMVAVDGGPLVVSLMDTGGFDPYFRINSLEIRPLASVGEIVIERVGGAATLEADGLTIDTYQASGAPPNAVITLETTLGTIVTPDLPLAVSPYMGMQILSDANGNFSFQVRRPSGTGAGASTISAMEVAARAKGSLAQPWEIAVSRKFDFNAPNAATAAGFLDVQGTHGYNLNRGFGYAKFADGSGSAVGWFDRGGVDLATRDGHYGNDREFSIQVKPGVAYDIRTHIGDSQQLRDKIQVVVDNVAVHDVSQLSAGQFDVFEFGDIVSADGVLTIRLTDLGGFDPYYVLNALEIWESQAAPLSAVDEVFGSGGW